MRNDILIALDKRAKELKEKYGIDEGELYELLNLKGQASVIATEVDVPCDDVVKRYKIGESMEIVRCRTCIFFHSNSFWLVSRPTMANNMKGGALYEMLKWYCDYKDGKGIDEWDKKEKDNADTMCLLIQQVLTLPLDVFTDIGFCVNIAEKIIDERKKYYDRLNKEAEVLKPETEEDAMKNAAFVAGVEMAEKIKEELGDAKDNQ